MQEHHDAVGGSAMLIAGMLVQWIHGLDDVFLFIAHGAGAIAAVTGLWLIIRKAKRDKQENP
ncbi:MAG: hypothetical protein WCK04_05005 [Actinomycetes bacterium]